MTPFRSILFDLDGTLVDSLDDIAAALNHVLGELGMPTHERAAVETFIGDGARMLIRRSIPAGADENATLERFRLRYTAHLTVRTRPFPGVPELLRALRKRDVACAVLSNKPDAMTVEIVDSLLGDHPFVSVRGVREGGPRKPDPRAALEIAESMRGPIGFVGDTPVDMRTAAAAGMAPIGVAWGMRGATLLLEAGAALILEKPADLLGLVQDE